MLGPKINPPFVTDAYRGVPVSTDGPFPVVLFSHGASSFRLQSTALTTHLASWGFVVVSPDYFERGLQSLLGGVPDVTNTNPTCKNLHHDGEAPLGLLPAVPNHHSRFQGDRVRHVLRSSPNVLR